MSAVEQLRYTPNFGARAIAANRTGIIGAVIPTMENSIFAKGIEAFQRALVAQNNTMVVASSAYDPAQEAKLIRTLVARGADGMLLIGTDREPQTYAFLEERGIPYVISWAFTDEDRSFVGFDNRKASAQLVTKAIKLGHHSFAYISAKTEGNDRARDRILGAKDAIKSAGLDPTKMRTIETEYAIEIGRLAFDKLATTGPLPSLIICGNDVLAAGAIRGAQVMGLTVPDDISIIGFDDIDLATVMNPPLTTVHVPHREMGKLAAETLLSLIKSPDEQIKIELDTHVVDRGSLAPPQTR